MNSFNTANSVEIIRHRGPDETGFFEDEYCSLGMCRLAIVNVKSGQQPNFNHDNTIASVFNGEIYNFQELRKMLIQKGVRITSDGDSVLIPHLYQVFGTEMFRLLQGMFAIAIYDIKAREIVLGRDRLGKKPLWFCQKENELLFSSEIKGLMALGIERKLNPIRIQEFLRFGYINAPHSTFESVYQLEPASFLVFSGKGLKIDQYWNPSDVVPIQIEIQDAKKQAVSLIRDAVKSRLISERPIGAFLSGGIDSTIVAAIMQSLHGEQVHTFSIGFDDVEYDESKFARKVAQSIGSRHHEKIVSPDPNFVLDKLSAILDQPFADSSIIPTFILSDFARKNVVVALSGDGGDEAFGGYYRYRAATILDKVNPFLRVSPFNFISTQRISNPKLRKLIRHSRFMPMSQRYRGFQSFFQDSDFLELVNPEFLRDYELHDFQTIWNDYKVGDQITHLQLVDIKTYLPGDLLYKVDMASMASSLEVRSPFLDYRVVEFGLSLPHQLKFRGMENKFLLREIARDLVPRNLIDRPKMGFGIPLNRWLREDLSALLTDVLLDSTFQSRKWYLVEKIEDVIKLHHSGIDKSNVLWPILMMELWARKWLD